MICLLRRLAASSLLLTLACVAAAQTGSLPSDIPETFTPRIDAYDYDKREVMIAMRDGVKLKTFILVPKGAKSAPMLLTRTPYNAGQRVSRFNSPHLAAVVPQMNDTSVAAGYIIVYQDIRGKYGSEGDYVMTRPLRGPLNPTAVDHATDAYDTIEWLVKNVPESNGRVGTIGGSYEGYTTMLSTVKPHPALRVAVPFAPMVDGWKGDDWFHNGAFRQDATLQYIYGQEATRSGDLDWWSGTRDTYDEFLRAGSAADMAASRGLDQLGFWRSLVAHPAYDQYWQAQAVDTLLAQEPITVPMMIVSGLFDQEDIYGGPALFAALAPKDREGRIHLVMGPWNHGQGRREARALGAIAFEGDTAGWFRRSVMQPFLDHYLKDTPAPQTPRVLIYETGANVWQRYDRWPQSCGQGCKSSARKLYLLPQSALGFENTPSAGSPGYDEYISDPAKPVPYRQRPTLASSAPGATWGEWLVDDQRHVASRTDVLVYETEPLTAPLRVAGQPMAHLFASTTGSDADWVVKIIDVWPSEVPENPVLGGYQQMLSADILRGRYRVDPAKPQRIAANKTLEYTLALPQVSHTFLPGHRIMVQVQSSWFPLYDRNPQTYVDNIFTAKREDYVKATHRVWHTRTTASHIELPLIQ